ncbi:MAG TPA: hypothetical protein VKA76_11365 [Gammaproteobacteria bacterium]|nr:hypothetical protein [Gammaproteobacteria bacterium]
MKFPTPTHKSALLPLLALGALPITVHAALPADSPYATDPQSAYVEDATSDGIANLNQVLCIVHAMRPAAMVNKGPYVALVDMNKCDSRSQASASNSTAGASGATSAPNYMNAVVNITRADNTRPMTGKVWMSVSEQGTKFDVFVHLTATRSPGDAPPYGQFRVDYISKLPNGSTGFNGFIDANGPDVNYFETGQMSNNTALAMTATSTSSGSGTMKESPQGSPVTFNFAYDSSEPNYPAGVFSRSDGGPPVCFDRSKANAQKSVWRYGTYNANDGTRVDQANPGFPVTASYNGSSYYGFAGYWGINFQGLDLNTLADGPVAGATVKDQRPGNTATYSLSKVSGKLTKWTRNQKTLAKMDGIPFVTWVDLSSITNKLPASGPQNWQMYWDDANGQFVVTGMQDCSNGPCVVASVQPSVPLPAGALASEPLSGWADGFGGNIDIPYTASSTHLGTDPVYYYSQTQVIPGSSNAPSALYCVSNCPTAASINSFTSSGGSPFDSTTTQYGGYGTSQVTYSFDSGGLKESSTPMTVTDSNVLTGQYQYGVMTGRLFDALLSNANCPSGSPSGNICEPPQPSVYYTWQTGADQWNQTMWLTRTSDGTVVKFDPPENISYTVPNGSAYGTWAGKQVQLQFDGFGNLNGIPGHCVSADTNDNVDCSTANARYVPAFALPDGATMTLPGSGTPLIVKALDTEMRLAKVTCSTTNLSTPTANATLPTSAGLHDPSNSGDSDYIGVKPTVTDPPKVIDGVIQ